MATCIVLSMAAVVLIFIVIKLEVLPVLYDIRLSGVGIEFMLFSYIVVYTLEFENIAEVIEVRGGYRYVLVYNYKNRFSQTCFVIRKKRGIFTRQVLITPSNPSFFVNELIRRGIQVKSYVS